MPAVNGGSASSHGVLPFRKAINRSGSGEILRSLPGPSLFVCACWIPDAAASSSVERQALPDAAASSSAEQQALPHGAPLQCPGRQSSVPTVSCQQLLRHSAPASNKPHRAAKSTPVWLAIWHIWAGFANSQHRDASFATPKNICAYSSLLPPWAAAQTLANLSAHLPRLPTPPPYLRPMRLLHGPVRRYQMGNKAVAWLSFRFWMANDAVGCPWRSSCKSPRARILVLGTSGAHWPARWPQFELTERVAKS